MGQQPVALLFAPAVVQSGQGGDQHGYQRNLSGTAHQAGLSQEQLAEQVHVTRQVVSRWETGETVPNTETLKLLSRLFDVSINILLGSPRQLICQCCGMPLEDINISREPDGTFFLGIYKPPVWCVYSTPHRRFTQSLR